VRSLLLLSLLLAAPEQQRPPAASDSRGADYNITLVTDSAPDFTDVDSYLRSVTSQYSAPQDKAIGVWRWSQRLRKQTSFPTEGGHVVNDPVHFFSSYGYTMCGVISGINNGLWLNLGWKAHYVQLGDHTVCECSWDGGKTWHMFDNSMSFYCFNDRGEVASTREIEKNPRFYLENFAPECGTYPVKDLKDQQGWRGASDHPAEFQRTLANGVDSFLPPNEVLEDHLAAGYGRRYVLNLRSGETYTRHWSGLDGGKSDPRYYRPLHGKDVDVQKNIRGNGLWRYAPDLRDPASRPLVYSESGVTWTKDGVQGPGHVVFKVSAANVVTSARMAMGASGAAVSLSTDAGGHWTPVPVGSGETDLPEAVAGQTEYLVKVELQGSGATLSSLVLETITQLNRPALPRLVRGPNRVQVRLGRQVETITLAPSIADGNHRKTVHEEKSVVVNDKPYFNVATLCPAVKGEPCTVTWKVESPTPILDLDYGGNVCVKAWNGNESSAALLHSWDGKSFTEDFRKSDGSLPYDLVVRKRVDAAPAGSRDAYFRYQFETKGDPEKKWSSPGLQTALMTVHHAPKTTGYVPIEVTYCWVEHRDEGDVERRHTALITSPEQEYGINVGGYRDPTMKWVRMNLKGFGPEGGSVKEGYSDGKDVGPAAKASWAKYHWGKNLALGKRYTLEGKTDERNPDGGTDLTDGVIAPPDTYVSVKWMPTNVMFPKDVSPVVTLDLGAPETVAAVRIHSGAEPAWLLTHPDKIAVETSVDGKTFVRVGDADWKQVFTPPADFAAWEFEDGAPFAGLPAGGRLAYAYRILFEKPLQARYLRVTCTSRKGWGMLLSEIQAFDKVTVDRSVPPLVALPPIRAGR
jgi:hypothetical protein